MRASALAFFAGFVCVVSAACSTPATRSLPAHTADPPAAPTTPPPRVTFETMRLDATGLPAIAADGSIVVHTEIDGDGGRGNPNLTLVVKDRSDRERERIVVVTANDAEGQYDERGPSEALAAKIAKANARLADLHGMNDLRPLMTEAVAVELTPRRLTVRAGATVVVDIATPASWLVADRKLCASCEEVCTHPMRLESAHGGVGHKLVLLTIAYAGTDMCPEPVSQHHVITW